MQIPVDQIDFLKPPQAFTNLLGANLAHPFDRLQFARGGRLQFVEPAEMPYDVVAYFVGALDGAELVLDVDRFLGC